MATYTVLDVNENSGTIGFGSQAASTEKTSFGWKTFMNRGFSLELDAVVDKDLIDMIETMGWLDSIG